MRIHLAFALLAGLLLSATSGHAIDFYGANVTDGEVPSIDMKLGLYGIRPIVDTVAFGSQAAKQGFQQGDIILSINDREIKKTRELSQFTTDVLKVYVLRRNEKMMLFIDSLAIETPKAKRNADKNQSSMQRQLAKDVSVAVISPPLKTDDRALVKKNRKSTQTASADVIQNQEVSPRMKRVPQDKQAKTKNETVEKLTKTDCTEVSEKCGPGMAAATGSSAPTAQNDIFSRPIKPAQDQIVFSNTKGEVIFRHSTHLRSLDKMQCLSCHQIGNLTPESIQSRLNNNRVAHGFCKGCHQKTENGPSGECQACHAYTKKN